MRPVHGGRDPDVSGGSGTAGRAGLCQRRLFREMRRRDTAEDQRTSARVRERRCVRCHEHTSSTLFGVSQIAIHVFHDTLDCLPAIFFTRIRTVHRPVALYSMASKYIIYDIGIYGQIKGGKNQILINTWHGTSLKRIEYYLDKNHRKGMPPLCTYSIAYSDFFQPIIKKA